MGLGQSKIKEIMFERFDDALASALSRVHKNGQVFYVDSNTGSSSYNGQRITSPCATIDQAINLCTANQGDTIIVLPRHTETVTAAAGIAADVANINIIGLAVAGQKPQITFSTSTAASMTVSANGIKVKGLIGISGIDGLTKPFDLSGDDLDIDIEWRDSTSLIEAQVAVLATSVDRSLIKLRYHGQTGGDNCVTPIKMDGSTRCRVVVDFFGKASTSVVNFANTACSDINVSGYFYVSGTTNLSKNVVDTITGSTWSVSAFDGAAGGSFSGGSGAAVASDDISVIASNMNVPSQDSASNTVERDVVGNKTDTVAGNSLYSATLVPTADVATNTISSQAVGNKTDAAVTTVGTTKSIMAYAKGLINSVTGSRRTNIVALANTNLTGTTTRFTIANGPVKVWSMGILITTVLPAGANTCKFSFTPTGGSATDLSGATDTASGSAQQLFVVDGTKATALVKTTDVGILAAGQVEHMPVILSSGVVQTIFSAGPPASGAAVAFMEWEPLNTSATVS